MFGLLATLVLAAATVSQAQDLPPDCTRSVTVALYDTCDSIAAKNNVSTFQLKHVNKDLINKDCSNLHSGEVLCLGIKGQDCMETYVVQKGDFCHMIAGKYQIPLSTLYANNPNVDQECSNIYPDEVLCVSSTIYPYTQ